MKHSNVNNGTVLLADPFMWDLNFKRSAILLCEHNEEGSVGFILNKQLDMRVDEMLNDFPEFDSSAHFGGPVQTDTIHYIHDKGDILDGSIPIMPGIWWGGDFEKLKVLIDNEVIQPRNIRFFVGYSGRSSGQLRDELGGGSWVTADMHANYLFKTQPNHLWEQIMDNKGDAFSIIAQMPDCVLWN